MWVNLPFAHWSVVFLDPTASPSSTRWCPEPGGGKRLGGEGLADLGGRVAPTRRGAGRERPSDGAPPPRPGIVGQLPCVRGRTPGLPPRGRPPGDVGGAAVVRERPADSTPLTAAGWSTVSDHAVRPSRLRSSTASRTARKARRASPCSRCRCRSRPAIGAPGPARPGAEPTRSPAASRPLRRLDRGGAAIADCLTASRGGRCPPRGPPTARGRPRAGSGRRERPPSRRDPGRQLRHPDPVLAGEHAAVITGRPREAVKHRQPPLVREGLGDVRLGVTHQALELLTGRFDVGPVDRVRLPAPAVAVVGQPDGPPAREDGGATRRHLIETGRLSPSTSTAPAAQLPAKPMLTWPSEPGVSRASVRIVPSTKATRRGRCWSVGRCATNAPPSSTSSYSTACGESSDAWKPAP